MKDKILSAREIRQATEDKMAMLRNMANLCADSGVDDWKRFFPERPIKRDGVMCGFKKNKLAELRYETLVRSLKLEMMVTRCNCIEEKLDLLADLTDVDEELAEDIEDIIDEQAGYVAAVWNEYFPDFLLNRQGVLCGCKQIRVIAAKALELLRILEKEVSDD